MATLSPALVNRWTLPLRSSVSSAVHIVQGLKEGMHTFFSAPSEKELRRSPCHAKERQLARKSFPFIQKERCEAT